MIPVRTDKFSFNRAEMMMVADISDIPLSAWYHVYPDACDTGFDVVSVRTGRTVTFVVDQKHENGEGEITRWTMKPVKKAPWDPLLDKLRITLFND